MSFKGSGEIELAGKNYNIEIKITEKSSKGFNINPDSIKILLGLIQSFKNGNSINKSNMISKILKLLNIMKQSTNKKIQTTSQTIYEAIHYIYKDLNK